MPKVIDFTSLIREFGGKKVWETTPNKEELFCKLCTTSCSIKRRSVVAAHVTTAKHKKNLSLLEAGQQKAQQQLVTSMGKRYKKIC